MNVEKNSPMNITDQFPHVLLEKVQLFKGVAPDIINAHINQCELRSYQADEIILSPDRRNENIYIVIKGELSFHQNDSSKEVLPRPGIGEMVGELSIVDGQNPSTHIKTTQDSQLLIINSSTVWAMIDNSHQIARNLLYIMAQRVRSGNKSVETSLQLQQKHEKEAQVDILTGLYNRRWINETLARHYSDWQANTLGLSIVMIDIDNFKSFNDNYGHLMGDHVLKKVAGAMKNNLRPEEIVARFGGEEFIILLPGISADDAQLIAERVRTGVAEYFFYDENSGQRIPVTISLGVAELEESSSMEELLNNADQALYRAKKQGRNQVQVYRN